MRPSTPVDKLEFLVLVDNCIEWFSNLPPGFTHELPQHMSRPTPNDPPRDPLTGLPILDLDNFCCGAHGLSILITTTIDGQESNVLLDAGPEELSVERNVNAMKARLQDLDAIVLSHWHRDHSGGIPKALKLRQSLSTTPERLHPLKVDLHPSRPIRRGISRPPDYIPIAQLPEDPTFEEIEALGGVVELNDEYHEILCRSFDESEIERGSGVGVSGRIKRRFPYEKGLPGAITWMKDGSGEEGWFTDEQIWDERYVVVDVRAKGLVVFSSCSHAGICNVLADAMEKYDRPIYMVVGGFHLVPTPQQPAKETVKFLARRLKPRPKYVLPLHCTGLQARGMIKSAMGEGCIPAGVGMKVVVDSLEVLGIVPGTLAVDDRNRLVDEADRLLDEVELRILE